jgi:hypothetical protein
LLGRGRVLQCCIQEISIEMVTRSVTQNLSDGLRAIVMSSVGRKCRIYGRTIVTHILLSWCHVLLVPHANCDDVGNCSTSLSRCCE